MTNPYSTPLPENASPRESEIDAVVSFLLKHFVAFQVSFYVTWLTASHAYRGFDNSLEIWLNTPSYYVFGYLEERSLPLRAWLFHAVLGCAYPKMRQAPVTPTAMVGSVAYYFGFFGAIKVLPEVLPESMLRRINSMDFAALSLAAVWLFVRLRFSSTPTGRCRYTTLHSLRKHVPNLVDRNQDLTRRAQLLQTDKILAIPHHLSDAKTPRWT